MAVSRDSGVTFAPPVRVTRQADARINAERPPVIVLAPTAGGAADNTPDVAVLWTGGKTATTITVAAGPGNRVVAAWRHVYPGRDPEHVQLAMVSRPARHPVLAVTPRGVLVAWTDGTANATTRIGVKTVPME